MHDHKRKTRAAAGGSQEPSEQMARLQARFASEPVSLAAGGRARLYAADIPGHSAMDSQEQRGTAGLLKKKIRAGQKLHRVISEALDPAELAPPSREDASNLLWFLKSKANEAATTPYEKGAMTIPDPGNRIRTYLDRMQTEAGKPEIYARRSTHLQERQLGGFSRKDKSDAAQDYLAQHQPRGSDFYEGVAKKGGIGDPKLLLPSGMRTFLYQQVETPGGNPRLYIKMETEGARADLSTPKYRGGVQSRSLRPEDFKHTMLHGLNLVKKKVLGGQSKQRHLPQLREDVPKPIQKIVKQIISGSKLNNPEVYNIMMDSSSIGKIYQNLDKISDESILVSDENMILLTDLLSAIVSTVFHGDADLYERFGEEVVLTHADLGGPRRALRARSGPRARTGSH